MTQHGRCRDAAAEADRQLPVGGEIFLDHVGHFVRDPQAASAALAPRGLCADAGFGAGQSRRHADRHRQRHRDVHAAAISRCCSRPPTRRSAREFEAALAGHSGVHLAAFSVADAEATHQRLTRGGLCDAAAGAVPAPGRHRERAGRRRLHGGAARARRDGGGPHPDAHASHRGHGVAEALAVASATARWA